MATAEKYYLASARKDLTEMAQYLHPDVEFISPFATLAGSREPLSPNVRCTILT